MLKNSILASNLIFISTTHSNSILKKYFRILDTVFKKIRNFEDGKEVEILNKIPVCHNSFRRLN